MKTLAIIEKDGAGYSVFTDNLKTVLHGSGATVKEAKEEMLAGYSDLEELYREQGRELPAELRDLTFVYKYDIASLFNAFDFLNATKFAERVGISTSLMRHYKSGDTYISDTQAKKIERGLHKIARELLMVSL
ncbi:MAG: pilus assembly protein HicB [Bacteroidales bacterium]|nr:pilus assembly protein HicB [Bacteroidales bacterium]